VERKTALMVSMVVSGSLVLGAVAFAASLGMSDASADNVGNLQPVATDLTQPPQPTEVTLYLDPVTGVLSTTPPAPVGQPIADPAQAQVADAVVPTPGPARIEGGGDRHDDEGRSGGESHESHETRDDDD